MSPEQKWTDIPDDTVLSDGEVMALEEAEWQFLSHVVNTEHGPGIRTIMKRLADCRLECNRLREALERLAKAAEKWSLVSDCEPAVPRSIMYSEFCHSIELARRALESKP